MVHHAATRWMLDTYEEAFREEHLWAMPVVTETYDGVLNDINGQHVGVEHVRINSIVNYRNSFRIYALCLDHRGKRSAHWKRGIRL